MDVCDSEDLDCDNLSQTSSSHWSFVSCQSSASIDVSVSGYGTEDEDFGCNCAECADFLATNDCYDSSDMFQYCQPCIIGDSACGINQDLAVDDGDLDNQSYFSADEYSYDASYGDGSEDASSVGLYPSYLESWLTLMKTKRWTVMSLANRPRATFLSTRKENKVHCDAKIVPGSRLKVPLPSIF